MYETPSRTTPFYRVTRPATKWAELLKGEGAFFTPGGRYHGPDQPTVYAADDPIVSISEQCYYQALEWQGIIGSELRPARLTFPLITLHMLWCFSLKEPPRLLDLSHDIALETFGFRHLTLLNPSRVYGATKQLADEIRIKRSVGGMKAPSIRAISQGGGYASQVILFPGARGLKADKLWKCELSIEFTDRDGESVGESTPDVDWGRPRFKLQGGDPGIPVASACLGSSIPWDDWVALTIRHA